MLLFSRIMNVQRIVEESYSATNPLIHGRYHKFNNTRMTGPTAGTIFQAFDTLHQTSVIWHEIDLSYSAQPQKVKETLVKEYTSLQTIKHPNVRRTSKH